MHMEWSVCSGGYALFESGKDKDRLSLKWYYNHLYDNSANGRAGDSELELFVDPFKTLKEEMKVLKYDKMMQMREVRSIFYGKDLIHHTSRLF